MNLNNLVANVSITSLENQLYIIEHPSNTMMLEYCNKPKEGYPSSFQYLLWVDYGQSS